MEIANKAKSNILYCVDWQVILCRLVSSSFWLEWSNYNCFNRVGWTNCKWMRLPQRNFSVRREQSFTIGILVFISEVLIISWLIISVTSVLWLCIVVTLLDKIMISELHWIVCNISKIIFLTWIHRSNLQLYCKLYRHWYENLLGNMVLLL